MSSQQKTGSHRDTAVEAVEHGSPSAGRSIFRSEALRHYQENQEKVVLPPLASPRSLVYLWIFAGLTMAAGLLLAAWPWLEPWVAGVT